MDRNTIAIATITLVRDEEEESLLRASLQQLAALQVPVFITDGGSPSRFLHFLRSFPHFSLSSEKKKGVWAQAKNSLYEAGQSGAPFILYTEPDKLDFFARFLPRMLAEASLHEQLGVVLAERSGAGFSTFPLFQQMTEKTINNCCAEVIGMPFDYTYGPFLLNKELVPYLERVQEDVGWGWRPFVFGIAARLGYGVEAFTEDFSCPPEQLQDNAKERLYRMRQLSQNIEGLVLSTTVDLGNNPALQAEGKVR